MADQTIAVPTEISAGWDTAPGRPSGGHLMELLLRRVQEHAGPGWHLVLAATSFFAGAQAGPALAECRIARQGRTLTHGDAVLRQGDTVTTRTSAVLAARLDRSEFDRELTAGPQLPDPEDCIDPRDHGGPTHGMFGQIEYRLREATGSLVGRPAGDRPSEQWARFVDGRTVDAPVWRS